MATPRKDWKKEYEKIAAESRKLAKRANQRLVRLEQYSKREGYKPITKYAYSEAAEYIEKNLGIGKSGKPRFKEFIKLYDNISDGTKNLTGDDLYKTNVMIQRNRIKAMESFLAAESSTLGKSRIGPETKGIKAIYDQRTQTINDKITGAYGAELGNYTPNELKRFFESKKQAKLEKIVGSDMMFVVAKVMKKEGLKTRKRELEKYFKEHINLKDDKSEASKDGLKESDLKTRKGEGYKEYIDRLGKYVQYTGDEVLNQMINKALKEGINKDNIFI